MKEITQIVKDISESTFIMQNKINEIRQADNIIDSLLRRELEGLLVSDIDFNQVKIEDPTQIQVIIDIVSSRREALKSDLMNMLHVIKLDLKQI